MPDRRGVLPRGALAVVLAVLVAGAVAGCRSGARHDSVLLISLDTLRADHVSSYGSSPVQTPHLDGLAKRGARMTRAWTAVPMTTPAHASILTGLYPPAHGVRNNARFRLPEDVPTLAETLKASGARTAAFVASFTTSRLFGLGQGFDVFDDDFGNAPGPARRRKAQRRGDEVVARATAWLAQNAKAPFFLWVHLYDPHAPYDPPLAYEQRFPDDPYSAEVAFTDAMVGEVLDALEKSGAARRTVVVALADHGEGLGEHGEDRHHGLLLYEEALRIPFFVVAPGGVSPGTEVREPASIVDVVPTVLGLLGKPSPAGVHGRDLLASPPAAKPRHLYAETLYPREEFGWSALYAVRRGDLKYVHSTAPEMYDLAADSGEKANLAGSRAADARGLAGELRREAAAIARADRLASAAGLGAPDRETVERLQSLGYVAGGGAGASEGPLGGVSGRPPREAMPDFAKLKDAQGLMRDGLYADAVRDLEALVRSDGGNPQVLLKLAQAHEAAKDFPRAEGRYRELIARHPTFYLGHGFFSEFLERTGRPRESRDLWLRLRERVPGYAALDVRTAQAEIAGGLLDDAVRRLEGHLTRRSDDAEAWATLGTARAGLGRTDAALEAFRRSLAIVPTAADAVGGALQVLESTGRVAEARRLLQDLLARAPEDPVLVEAAERLRGSGRTSDVADPH